MNNTVKIKLTIPGKEALLEILKQGKIDLECGPPKKTKEGDFIITLYTDKETAKKVEKLGYKAEIDEQFGERLKQRQDQVSRINRFKDGRQKPFGLGIKK